MVQKNIMIRIAFIVNFNPNAWLGGYNVIKNLIWSIYLNKPKNIKIVLFVNKDIPSKFFKKLPAEIIKTNFFKNFKLVDRILTRLEILILGKSKNYDNFFLKHKIDFVSHFNPLGRKSKINSFCWIPDFQEIHYPKYFTIRQLILRRLNLFYNILNSTKIILSSNTVKKDLKKIIKVDDEKLFVHQFYFKNYPLSKIIKFRALNKKFKIKKNYFFLPNQYWPHKNHMLVLKAIHYLLNKKKISLNIVSTGYNYVRKSKKYFQQIMNYRNKNNLKVNYKYLGIVSDKELYSLIYHSIATINPSFFEGWNTSVMQVKSLNKSIILSNISSHLEQKDKNCVYFKNGDYKSLVKKIQNFKSNKIYENKLMNKKNFYNYGKKYIELVNKIFKKNT